MCPNGGWPRSWPRPIASVEVLVQPQRPRDGPRDPAGLERVREPGAVVVALRRDEHLGLVLEPPERLRVHDPVAVALERRSDRAVGLGLAPDRRVRRRRPSPTGTPPSQERTRSSKRAGGDGRRLTRNGGQLEKENRVRPVPETALVTGASSGIGEQFAPPARSPRLGAGPGRRRADRLEALAGELPTDAQAVPCDLATEAASLPGQGRRARRRRRPARQQRRLRHLAAPSSSTTRRATPSRSGSTARRSSPSPTPSFPRWWSGGRGGDHQRRLHGGHAAAPLRIGLRGHEGLRDQLHRRRSTPSCAARVSASSPSTPGRFPPSGRRSPDTRESGWPSFRARSPPSRSSARPLAAYDRGRRSVIPGRTIRWFIRATRPPARAAAAVTERMYRPKQCSLSRPHAEERYAAARRRTWAWCSSVSAIARSAWRSAALGRRRRVRRAGARAPRP